MEGDNAMFWLDIFLMEERSLPSVIVSLPKADVAISTIQGKNTSGSKSASYTKLTKPC